MSPIHCAKKGFSRFRVAVWCNKAPLVGERRRGIVKVRRVVLLAGRYRSARRRVLSMRCHLTLLLLGFAGVACLGCQGDQGNEGGGTSRTSGSGKESSAKVNGQAQ